MKVIKAKLESKPFLVKPIKDETKEQFKIRFKKLIQQQAK